MALSFIVLGGEDSLLNDFKVQFESFMESGDLGKAAFSAQFLGDLYYHKGLYDEACKYYEECLALYHILDDEEKMGRIFLSIADCKCRLNKVDDDTLELFSCWSTILEWSENKTAKCSFYLSMGILYQNVLHGANGSIAYLKMALQIANEIGLSDERERAYDCLASLHVCLGNFEEAFHYYSKLIQSCEESGNTRLEAMAYENLVVLHLRTFNIEEALKCTQRQFEVAVESERLIDMFSAYSSMGQIFYQQNSPKEAKQYHNECLKLAASVNSEYLEALACIHLGNVCIQIGENYDAINHCSKAIEVLQHNSGTVSNRQNVGLVFDNLGEAYMKIGETDEAIACREKSLEIAKQTGDIPAMGIAYINLAKIYDFLCNDEKARGFRLMFIVLAVRMEDKRGEMYFFQELGKCYLKSSQIQNAVKCLKKSIQFAIETKESSSIIGAYYALADMHSNVNQYDEAISINSHLLQMFVERGDKNYEARWHMSLGNLYHLSAKDSKEIIDIYVHKMELSEQHFKECIHISEDLFDELQDNDQFKLSISDLYLRASAELALVLVETGRTNGALMVSERSRARILREALASKHNVHWEDFSFFPEEFTDAELLDILPPDNCVLFYCSYGALLIWMLSQSLESIKFVQNTCQREVMSTDYEEIPSKYVHQVVKKLYEDMDAAENADCEDRSLVRSDTNIVIQENTYSTQAFIKNQRTFNLKNKGSLSSSDQRYRTFSGNSNSSADTATQELFEYDDPMEELFHRLITPVKEYLTSDEIVIVPSGLLYFVPFPALTDPETGCYLCETKRIRLVPSLTCLRYFKQCSDDYHSKVGALIVGNPEVGEVMFRGKKKRFYNLPAAEREAALCGAILGAEPLIGIHATKDAVKNRLQDVAIIHIAAHGDDTNGQIAFAPGISSKSKPIPEEEDYILTIQEVQEIGIRAQLVVLSCCHSGRGEVRAEGVMGMSRAFLAAGARAVVASLWAIDDFATNEFMSRFYMYLKDGDSISVSLNKAMNYLSKVPRYDNPIYWAPFFLFGDNVTVFKRTAEAHHSDLNDAD